MSRKLFVDASIDKYGIFSYEDPREAFSKIFNFFDEKEVNAFFELCDNGIIDEKFKKGNYIYERAVEIADLKLFKQIQQNENEKFSQNVFVNSLKEIASNVIMSQGLLQVYSAPNISVLKEVYAALDKERQPKEKKGAIDASQLSDTLKVNKENTKEVTNKFDEPDKANKEVPGDDPR